MVHRRPSLASRMLVLLLLCIPSPLPAKDTVTWMEAVFPPFYIQSGANQEQGYGDIVTDILQEHLSDYEHEEVITNITRHFYKFKQGEKVCSAGLYKTAERDAFMYFSIPSFITLPPVLIIKKENIANFGHQTTVPLADVLANKGLMIGLAKDRSYGKTLDAILEQHKGQGNLVEFTGQELSFNLFQMLLRNRLDGIIVLPEEALYQAEQMGIRGQVLTLTLAENLQNYDGWMSSVGCSKNAWGKEMIEKINAILLEQRPTERYRAAYERWLDAGSIEQYRKAYSEVFLKTRP